MSSLIKPEQSPEFSNPNKSIIEKYHSIVFSIFENMKNNKLSKESLIQTRDTLLPKLMSGEIRVSDFES